MRTASQARATNDAISRVSLSSFDVQHESLESEKIFEVTLFVRLKELLT